MRQTYKDIIFFVKMCHMSGHNVLGLSTSLLLDRLGILRIKSSM